MIKKRRSTTKRQSQTVEWWKVKHDKQMEQGILGERAAVDTETTGELPFFVSYFDDQEVAKHWEWNVDPLTRQPIIPDWERNEIGALVSRGGLICHNTKFDLWHLEKIGVQPEWAGLDDTLVASHLLFSSEPHGLKDLCVRFLDISDRDQDELRESTNKARAYARSNFPDWMLAGPETTPTFSNRSGWWVYDTWLPRAICVHEERPDDDPWWTVLSTYAIKDAERTMCLWAMFEEWIEEDDSWDLYRERIKNLEASYSMERQGVPILDDNFREISDEYTQIAKEKEESCLTLGRSTSPSFENIRSTHQLSSLLYTHWDLPVLAETTSGNPSCSASVLEELLNHCQGDPYTFISDLLLQRKHLKAVEYLDSYWKKSLHQNKVTRLFPRFNITGTATTRWSSHDPNTQNISKQKKFNLRKVFGPPPGHVWYSLDYENIEFRIFAYSCGDQNLIDAFESGQSMHLVIAERLYPALFDEYGPEGFKDLDEYRMVKSGNFAMIYGASQKKTDATYGIPGAYQILRKELPLIDRFMRSKFDEARATGHIRTLGGYPLQVPSNKPHVAVNYFCQGSAGVAMTLAVNRVFEYLKDHPKHHMIMQIHDELDLLFPKKRNNRIIAREIRDIMAGVGNDIGLPTPVDCEEITTNWSEGIVI